LGLLPQSGRPFRQLYRLPEGISFTDTAPLPPE
jgi:hypothetical protein